MLLPAEMYLTSDQGLFKVTLCAIYLGWLLPPSGVVTLVSIFNYITIYFILLFRSIFIFSLSLFYGKALCLIERLL